MTVDEFIDDYTSDAYASWVLNLLRLPAALYFKFKPWANHYKLFCTYEGETYRVTMASRMGDIGLSKNFDVELPAGYEKRVSVVDCFDWRDCPETNT